MKFAAKASFVENKVPLLSSPEDLTRKRPLREEQTTGSDKKPAFLSSLKIPEDLPRASGPGTFSVLGGNAGVLSEEGISSSPVGAAGVGVRVIGARDPNAADHVVLLLHGAPGSSMFYHGDWLRFEENNICGLAVDMPGFGMSDGLAKMACHSSQNLKEGGPVDLLMRVVAAFGVFGGLDVEQSPLVFGGAVPNRGRRKISVFGFDWGGGLALHLAEQFPSYVHSVVVFHAMFNEPRVKIRCPTTLLWVKSDQFHPVKLGRALAKKIEQGGVSAAPPQKQATNGSSTKTNTGGENNKPSVGGNKKPNTKRQTKLYEFDAGHFKSGYNARYPSVHEELVPRAVEGLLAGIKQVVEDKAVGNIGHPSSGEKRDDPHSSDMTRTGGTSSTDERSSETEARSRGRGLLPAIKRNEKRSSSTSSFRSTSSWTRSSSGDSDRSETDEPFDSLPDSAEFSQMLGFISNSLDNFSTPPIPIDHELEQTRIAISVFRRCHEEQWLPHLYALYLGKLGGSGNPLISKLFGRLPQLLTKKFWLKSAKQLIELGIWRDEDYALWVDESWGGFYDGGEFCARPSDVCFYPPGRTVFFLASGVSDVAEDCCRLLPNADDNGEIRNREAFRGWGTLVHGFSDGGERDAARTDPVEVEVRTTDNSTRPRRIRVSKAHIREQNSPLWLRADPGAQKGNVAVALLLEDGIRANFASPLLRARLLEILLQIEHRHPKSRPDLLTTIRRCLNLTCLYQKLDRRRYCRSDDVGKLATYGTAHCHGMTSVLAAVLYPFSHVFGLYQRYTGGYSGFVRAVPLSDSTEVVLQNRIRNRPERHQWLELACVSRGGGSATRTPAPPLGHAPGSASGADVENAAVYDVDVYVADLVKEVDDKRFVCLRVEEAYTHGSIGLYANGQRTCGTWQ